MAGVRFTQDMQYNNNPPTTANLMIDVGGSKPEYTKLSNIKTKIFEGVSIPHYQAYLINKIRGCFNINTASRTIELSSGVTLITSDGQMSCVISAGATSYGYPDYPDIVLMYVHCDFGNQTGTLWAYRQDHPPVGIPATNMYFVGAFAVDWIISPPLPSRYTVEGLSINNDDVKVNGSYICDIPQIGVINRDIHFVTETKDALQIDTVNKEISLSAKGSLIVTQDNPHDETIHEISPFSAEGWWDSYASAGNNLYLIYAIIVASNTSLSKVVVVSASGEVPGITPPGGIAYCIGGFYFDGNEVTSVTYPGDLQIDGMSLRGTLSGGGSVNPINLFDPSTILTSNDGLYWISRSNGSMAYAPDGVYAGNIYTGFTSAPIPVEAGVNYEIIGEANGIFALPHAGGSTVGSINLRYLESDGTTIVLPMGVGSSYYHALQFMNPTAVSGMTNRWWKTLAMTTPINAAFLQFSLAWTRISDGAIINNPNLIKVYKV